MFYKAIGFVVWKFASAYVRQRYGRSLRAVALVAGIASILAAAYLATRSGDED
jgi:hypothetical protein